MRKWGGKEIAEGQELKKQIKYRKRVGKEGRREENGFQLRNLKS
jgi:hypothetical protein